MKVYFVVVGLTALLVYLSCMTAHAAGAAANAACNSTVVCDTNLTCENNVCNPPCACIEIGNSCDFANRFKPEDGSKNRENVALGKKTQLSTSYGAFRPGYGAYLNKQGCLAVNGNRNLDQIYYYDDAARANCIHSGEFDSSPWWSLDLLESYSILNIVIYSRIGYEDRMVNVTITVDGRICNKFTQTPQAVTNLNCTTPLTGRFINVSKSGPIDKLQVHTLNICEVEVWVCRDGYYGDDCSLKCGACDDSTRCLSDGSCVNGCEEGWQGDKCTEACPDGYYGKGCTLKCDACENVKCHTNGTCLAGCEEGWNGDMCTEAVSSQAAGESCGSNSTCNATLVCESSTCKLQIGAACNSSGQCLNGSSCQGSVCKIQAGTACNSSNSGMCITGTTCQYSICRYQAGHTCTDGVNKCVVGANCTTVNATCICDVTKFITVDGICMLKLDQYCNATSSPTCINNAECLSTVCKCKASYTANPEKTACSNASGLMISVILLFTVYFITSCFA